MTVFEKVFDGTLVGGQFSYTDYFSEANFFFIEVKGASIDEGVEVAAALLSELKESPGAGLPTIEWREREVPININQIVDSQQVIRIPYEFRDTKLRNRVIFYPAEDTTAKCWVVKDEIKNNNECCQEIIDKIDSINDPELIDNIFDITISIFKSLGGDPNAILDTFGNLVNLVEGLPSSGEQPEVPGSVSSFDELISIYGS